MTDILVLPRAALAPLPVEGVWPVDGWPGGAQWRRRAAVEADPRWLQPIPYLLIRNRAGRLWCYRRRGGDARLLARRSCGVGGHVERIDAADGLHATVARALRREAGEELANGADLVIGPALAWLYEGRSAIGRVHIGLIHVADWRRPEPPRVAAGEPLQALGFLEPAAVVADARFERWSRLAAGHLAERVA